jgi:hypothetical protein
MGVSKLCAIPLVLVLAACGQGTKTAAITPAAAPAPAPPPAFTPVVENASAATLAAAFQAAFGAPAPAILGFNPDANSNSVQTDAANPDHTLQFAPTGLIDLSPGVVALVSKGTGDATNYTCDACGGTASVDYLQRGPQGFTKLGHWIVHSGAMSFGESAPWTLRNDLDSVPMVVFTVDGGVQGCQSTFENFVELTHAGPKEVGSAFIASSRQQQDGTFTPGDYQYVGALWAPAKGQTLEVDYTGTATVRVVFTKGADGQFHPPGGGPQTNPPVC